MKLLRQIVSLLLTRWIILILGFGISILVARTLGPELKGVVSLLGTLMALLAVVGGLGLPTAAAYAHKNHQRPIAEILTVFLVSLVLSTLILGLLLFWRSESFITLFIGEIETGEFQPGWLWLSFATLPGLIVSAFLGVMLIIDNKNRLYFYLNAGAQFVGVVLTFILVLILKWGVIGVLIANLAIQLVPITLLGYWLRSFREEQDIHLRISASAFSQMFSIGFQQYFATVIATLFKRGESFLLALLLDLKSVGFYTIALTMIELIIDIPRTIVWPMVGRLAEDNATDRVGKTAKSVRYQLIAMTGLLVIIALTGPIFIQLAYGDAYRSSIILFVSLLPAVLFRTIHLGTLSYFVGIGKPATLSPAVIVGAIINLSLGALLIPRVGSIGAAEATVVGEALLALMSVVLFVRASKVHWMDVVIPKAQDFRDLSRYVSTFRINAFLKAKS